MSDLCPVSPYVMILVAEINKRRHLVGLWGDETAALTQLDESGYTVSRWTSPGNVAQEYGACQEWLVVCPEDGKTEVTGYDGEIKDVFAEIDSLCLYKVQLDQSPGFIGFSED